jgi:hypothetical protein
MAWYLVTWYCYWSLVISQNRCFGVNMQSQPLKLFDCFEDTVVTTVLEGLVYVFIVVNCMVLIISTVSHMKLLSCVHTSYKIYLFSCHGVALGRELTS